MSRDSRSAGSLALRSGHDVVPQNFGRAEPSQVRVWGNAAFQCPISEHLTSIWKCGTTELGALELLDGF